MTTTKQSAEVAYIQEHAQAIELIESIKKSLHDLPAPSDVTNSGHVGNIGDVNHEPSDLVDFLNGNDR